MNCKSPSLIMQALLEAFKEAGVTPQVMLPPLDLPDAQYHYRHKVHPLLLCSFF